MPNANHSLHFLKCDNGIVIIIIYVGDLIVGSDNMKKIEDVKVLIR